MKVNRIIPLSIACCAMMAAAISSAQAAGKGYTWIGADGGSWQAAMNWDDGTGQSTGFPGSTDFAQFKGFSGKVAGAVGASQLDVGPGSDLTLDGSGTFDMITVGQDFDANAGDATLTISSGNVVNATLVNLGSDFGAGGTLVAQGPGATFSTSGGITTVQLEFPCSIVATGGGKIYDGASLSMPNGGLIQVDSASEVVIGDDGSGGNLGTLTITDGHSFDGEGTIAGNVIVIGTLQTFNAGSSQDKLTVQGNLTGTGAVSVVQELDISGAIGSEVTISLLGNGGSNKGLLRLAQADLDLGTLDTMSTGSVIALSGLSYDDVSWSDADGLTLTGSSLTLNLATSGDHSHQGFSVDADPISGTDILIGDSSGGGGADSYNAASRELTIPTLVIGGARYSNVSVTVENIITPPSGTSPDGSTDSYDPVTGQLTVQSVRVGSGTFYNAVVSLSALDSIGAASGIDTYSSGNNQLTIPAVQVQGGAAFRNVIITVGAIKSVSGGMPKFTSDQYTPATKELLIPVVQAYGHIYTNVLITVGTVVSVP